MTIGFEETRKQLLEDSPSPECCLAAAAAANEASMEAPVTAWKLQSQLFKVFLFISYSFLSCKRRH